jgi:hypothetical protein
MRYASREQFVPFHERTQRWACIVAHRRAGKTVACIGDLVLAALTTKKTNARFAYITPHYNQAKDVAWQYVKDFASQVPGATFNESELRVDFPNGARLRLYGADNYDRLRGVYFDGVVLDEFADMDPRAWTEVIRPALSDRNGWAVFIGTPKGENAFYEVYERSVDDPEWFSLMLKSSQTGILPPDELRAARRDMTVEQFAQEYECSFQAALQGAYYGRDFAVVDEDERVCSVPVENSVPVNVAFDLGIGDSTALIFFQQVGREIRIIDSYEASGHGLAHYAKVLQDRGYLYGDYLFPHDVEVRELGSGRSRYDTLVDLGINPTVVPNIGVDDGINAVRRLFPRFWFDKEKTRDLVRALRQYRTEFDEKRRVFKAKPLHDWTSHYADAMRYLAVGLQETKPKSTRLIRPDTNWIV